MSKNNSIPRLYDYANYCAVAVYRFSKDAGEDIILYSMAPFFKLHFYKAYLDGEESPDWESIEATMSDFVDSGNLDLITERTPLYEFFSDVVDGTLKEMDQRVNEARAYFKGLSQISGKVRELVDSIINKDIDLEEFVDSMMEKLVSALEPEEIS